MEELLKWIPPKVSIGSPSLVYLYLSTYFQKIQMLYNQHYFLLLMY